MLPLPKNSSLFCQLLAGQACLSHRYVSFRYFMQIHISSFSLLNSKLNRRKHISALSRSADCQWHWKVGLSRLVRSIASAQCAVQLLTQQCRSARFGRGGRLGVPGRCAAGPPFNCRDAKSGKHGKHSCAIFYSSCAYVWAIDTQRLCTC